MIDPGVEERVAARLDAGDLEEAASEIVRAYGPQLLGYLRSVLAASQADDAFSMFCEFVWKQLPAFRREASALTWAYRLAWGAVRRISDDPFYRRADHLSSGRLDAIAQEVRSTTAMYLKPETAAQLAALRAELDVEEQTLLVLRVDRDLPWSEIASILDATEDATAQARLRKRYERLVDKIRTLARQRGMLPA